MHVHCRDLSPGSRALAVHVRNFLSPKDMAAVDAGTDKADFNQAAGENYKRATSLLQCPSQCCKLVVLAIVMEPLRLLHSYFLETSKLKQPSKVLVLALGRNELFALKLI